MSKLTRCPQCSTTFRVSVTQLSKRGGRVRCGQCSAVFDGQAHLFTDQAAAVLPERPPDIPADFPESAVVEKAEVGNERSTEAEPRVEFVAPEVPPRGLDAPAAPVEEALPVEAPPPRRIVVPAFLARERPQAAYTALWILCSLVALGCLALQAALHFRTEIAVLLPSTRIYLETACETLGCEVRLPRRADLMSIESSDLQADSQRPGGIVLNALLRNRAPFAQEYPELELTLTDQGDRAVIRRVLGPADYLQEKRSAVVAGLAGGAEEAVRVHFDTGGVAATGYQLFLFYPCPAPAASGFWQLSYPSRCQDSRNK
jgi:predicted Zn finger-like uncharacterized protein